MLCCWTILAWWERPCFSIMLLFAVEPVFCVACLLPIWRNLFGSNLTGCWRNTQKDYTIFCNVCLVLSWYQYPTDRTNVSCAHPILCQIISCFAEALLEVSFVGVKDEVIRFPSLLLMMCRLQAAYQYISCCLFWKFLYVHVQKWAIVWNQIRRCS